MKPGRVTITLLRPHLIYAGDCIEIGGATYVVSEMIDELCIRIRKPWRVEMFVRTAIISIHRWTLKWDARFAARYDDLFTD